MERAADKPASVQRSAASERKEAGGELSERVDLEGLLPEGISPEMALQILGSAGLTIEEALELYERGELESRAQDLGPEELAVIAEIVQATTDEEPAEAGRLLAGERTACSCEEDEDEAASVRRAAAPRLSTKRRSVPPLRQPGRALIVADAARRLSSGQMRRRAFLARLEAVVRTTAEAALAGSGRSARDCPYIERSLRYYRTQDSRHIERAVRRYAPAAVGARSTGQYLAAIQERVETAVARWARTGEITGVPRGVPAPLAASLVRDVSAAGATRPVLRSGADGATTAEAHPQALRARLGDGRPLDGSTRGRMESAFGTSFSAVRVHTDAGAAALSSNLRARAFALGEDVAFAGGRYAPGTPVGDALIAHELAHVLQQRGSDREDTTLDHHAARKLEDDADRSAWSVAMSLWQDGRNGAMGLGRDALPRLRTGLRLSRCKDETPTPSPTIPCTPTMRSFEAKKTGDVVMTDVKHTPPDCQLTLFSPPSTPGMTLTAVVDVPRGCAGTLEFTQLIDRCFERRLKGTTNYKRKKTGGFALDNEDPYVPGDRVKGPGTFKVETNDSPGISTEDSPGLPNLWDQVHAQKDDFKMYLRWWPDGAPRSARETLGVVEWSWKGKADKTGSSGVCASDWTVSGPNAKDGKGTATTAVPTWTKVYPKDVPEESGRC